MPDDYWVLVQDGKVIKSGKGKPRFTSSRGQELMTVKYAKKMMKESKVTEAVDKDAARELEIYIENDQKLYKQKLIPIVKNIQKKIASGKYDHKKAPKLWMYLVDEAAKKYIKDHGSPGEKIDSMFNKETRMAVAQNLADNYRDEIDAQGGTMFESLDKIAEAAIDDLKKIVKDSQHGKVSGVKVDLFSASAMVQVYDALNDKNKKKVEKMLKDKRGVMTFAKFAMSQVK